MRISTRGRYGLRVLVDLADHNEEGPTSLKDIARRQQVSRKYLEQIMIALRLAGLVKSLPGSQGGYVLSRDPSQVQVSEVLLALEGPLEPAPCTVDAQSCERVPFCAAREVWTQVKRAVDQVLAGISLQDLVNRQREIVSQTAGEPCAGLRPLEGE
jgi:Rrf2 family protein